MRRLSRSRPRKPACNSLLAEQRALDKERKELAVRISGLEEEIVSAPRRALERELAGIDMLPPIAARAGGDGQVKRTRGEIHAEGVRRRRQLLIFVLLSSLLGGLLYLAARFLVD